MIHGFREFCSRAERVRRLSRVWVPRQVIRSSPRGNLPNDGGSWVGTVCSHKGITYPCKKGEEDQDGWGRERVNTVTFMGLERGRCCWGWGEGNRFVGEKKILAISQNTSRKIRAGSVVKKKKRCQREVWVFAGRKKGRFMGGNSYL